MLKNILKGEIEKKTITQLYGPPGVGKTNICIISSINTIKKGKKVVYIDTEGSLSLERIKQICPNDFEDILKNMIIYEPHDFEEQTEIIEKKVPLLYNIGLIVVDSIASLYRLELSDDVNKNARLNRILGRQILNLLKVAKKNDLAILITNQIRDTLDGFEATGGRILEYWSKTIVRIEKYEQYRETILEKHRYAKEGEKVRFRIVDKGIEIIE
ncbi:DNA repair and recombination protein RadB [Methanotorris formicicus]|uniref:DNA repair and recombination protein RadB n=1 Tax=Methanotorris formicicus Mc-S-70 TaxID=647171 RepID=H1KXH6_9EURY|nr:DNA repair and recombination protein RadB [Methanotorris formicicus]EHP88279.1 DNA repair and recombination protein RadB [Methanotorris formicicus Mc-S-70]